MKKKGDNRPAVDQARDSLEAQLAKEAEILEADRIAQGLPEGEYRGIAQIEAERHAKRRKR